MASDLQVRLAIYDVTMVPSRRPAVCRWLALAQIERLRQPPATQPLFGGEVRFVSAVRRGRAARPVVAAR